MTDLAAIGDPILARVARALDDLYGPRLARVVLFGSRARRQAGADSDYDVAVFLHDLDDRFTEMDRLADLGTEICAETGHTVRALPFPAGADRERSPLMHEIRRDGVDLR